MPRQLKKIAFLVPRADLARGEFNRYWREIHGPVVAGSPGYEQYRLKYVQNHIVGSDPVGEPFDFAGMAEFWLPGDNEDAFATTAIYRDRIKVDEMKFIDMDGTISMTAVEEIVREGSGALKLVVVRRGGAKSFGSALSMPRSLRGAVLNRVIEGSFRLPGARPAQATITSVEELWFDSEFAARGALSDLDADTGWSAFVAREFVFFDKGRPANPG